MKILDYKKISKFTKEEVFREFDSSIDGLTSSKADKLREIYGENKIYSSKKKSIFKEIIEAYLTPFTMVLILLGVISFITEYYLKPIGERDISTVIVISVLILISGTMSLSQSIKSNEAAQRLQDMVENTSSLKRDGNFTEIPMDEIVPGDIINLAAGDMIGADIYLFETKDLFVSETSLTGESYPVEKCAGCSENLAYMGTNVVSGSALGIVIATGLSTKFGSIADGISQVEKKTAFEIGIDETSKLLIKFMAIMTPIVFLINIFNKDLMSAFLFAVSIAVGLTPEMLPLIVNSNLIKGAEFMSKKGTIVKQSSSIQNFGAMDVLCTDKTGTLTEDKIVLEYHWNLNGVEDERVLRHAYLNSYYQTGLKNLLDIAIIEFAEKENVASHNYEKVDEIPFDFNRRRMSVVVKDENGKVQIITKGAIEEMLSVSKYVDIDGEIREINQSEIERVLEIVDDLNRNGMRVIGVSQKTNPISEGEFSIEDESDMVLIGYLAFLDPPKKSASAAISSLNQHGVDIKVLTGDNLLVTKNVCDKVGIETNICTSEDLDKMSDEEFAGAVEDYNVFVKLTPSQKAKIIRQLRENHVVAYMGDGINDALAMTESDVGISVDTAVDIAKESADIILLNKDLMVLEEGLLIGRNTFGDIMKYIKITISSNFGNMLSVLIASLFLPFLPMSPILILFLNLIYDISCLSIPFDVMDDEYLYEPKKWDTNSIKNFMTHFGPISSIFDILTYLVLYFVISPIMAGGAYHTLTPQMQGYFEQVFHSGWFMLSILSQVLVLYALRTEKKPFIESKPSRIMFTVTFVVTMIALIFPYTYIGSEFGLTALNLSYLGYLTIVVILYIFLVSIIKKRYIKKYEVLL